jgi:hypothetical protein
MNNAEILAKRKGYPEHYVHSNAQHYSTLSKYYDKDTVKAATNVVIQCFVDDKVSIPALTEKLCEILSNTNSFVTDNWHPEFNDFYRIIEMGAKKYERNNWLEKNGKSTSHKDIHASMFRHLANSQANNRLDIESGEDHLLHLICRAMMCYTRLKRNLVHPDDAK